VGRKSKPPITIKPTAGGTEVPPSDGLPPFRRFLDVHGQVRRKSLLTRVFFVTPTDQEIQAAAEERKSLIDVQVYVIAAMMPWMTKGTRTSTPLYDHSKSKGFSDEFSSDIVRLVVNHLQGRHLGRNSLYQTDSAMKEFVNFLSSRSEKPHSIADIGKEMWVEYLDIRAKDKRKKSEFEYNYARRVFSAYPGTAFNGWLDGLMLKENKRRKLAPEHTSELADNTRDYSDAVMYQLLALFIYTFEQRIGFLKRYEQVTEADMPPDWIYPGRTKAFPGRIGKGNLQPKVGLLTDKTLLLEKWLRGEDGGYETIINHCIMYYKVGLRKRTHRKSNWFTSQFLSLLTNYAAKYAATGLYKKFLIEMGNLHGYDAEKDPATFVDYYIKKKTADETHIIMNQIGWCLANLLIMHTGVNREVALTIPSLGEDGKSILNRGDKVFVKDGQSVETEINLYGYKARSGAAPERVVPIVIPKDGPLYQMLISYERCVKVSKDGPFFEFNKSFVGGWSTAGGVKSLAKNFPVIDESGEHLKTIEVSRFRKVFASGALLERMNSVGDMNELAALLREDLNHGNFDTTFSHYLLKSGVARSVMDIAIATVISGKLDELKCKSRIELEKVIPHKKKVFLCHCVDPTNPTHDVAIADECRHYDLCLGCEQSVITREHLPYICLRIIQYESERKKDPHIWAATFEDRWCIAHNALERYIETDKRHGRDLVDIAWQSALEGRVSLPPIISPTRL
jgi:hypothetical protein